MSDEMEHTTCQVTRHEITAIRLKLYHQSFDREFGLIFYEDPEVPQDHPDRFYDFSVTELVFEDAGDAESGPMAGSSVEPFACWKEPSRRAGTGIDWNKASEVAEFIYDGVELYHDSK